MARDMVYEKIPEVSRRIGDHVLANQNNSTLILGRDRFGSVDGGYGGEPGAGAFHAIVGRVGPDPSAEKDAATLYLSAKTDPDLHAGTGKIGQERKKSSGAVMRADCVRISARHDIKISIGSAYIVMAANGDVIINGLRIFLGEGATDRIILGDKFAEYWNTVTVPTPAGLSGPPSPLPEWVFSKVPVRVK